MILLSEENTREAQRALGVHRGRGDEPDTTITRKVLSRFNGMEQFRKWTAGLSAGVDPKEIKGDGYAFYLADAERWIESGGRHSPKRRTPKAHVSPYFDPRTITGPQPPYSTMDPETARRIKEGWGKRSTGESTMDPETARRIREARTMPKTVPADTSATTGEARPAAALTDRCVRHEG